MERRDRGLVELQKNILQMIDTAEKSGTDEDYLLIAQSGERKFAIEGSHIAHISDTDVPIVSIPMSGESLLGVIVVQGNVFSVLDLSMMTSSARTKFTAKSRFVCCENGLAVAVDLIDGFSERRQFTDSVARGPWDWAPQVLKYNDTDVLLIDDSQLSRGGKVAA